MSENLTRPQRYAIFGDCGNLLVSAAAGSGKTFTLSRHIVELVKTGKANIDEMLVVTFTRASAADMKKKIADALRKASQESKADDPALSRRLAESAIKAQSADISTIHSFLYKTLRRYFSSLDLPQDSRLVSGDTFIGQMQAEIMRDTVNELFETGDDDFVYLADILSTVRETDNIDAELFCLAQTIRSNGLEAADLGRYADALENSVDGADGILNTPIGKPVADRIRETLTHYASVFRWFSDELEFYTEVGEKYGSECVELIEWLDGALSCLDSGDLSAVQTMLAEFKRGRLTPIGKAKCDFSEEFAYHRSALKEDIKSLAKKFGSFTSEEIELSKRGTVRVLRCLEKVLEKYFDEFEQKKRSSSILEFSDLEYYALKLLVGENGERTPIAREIGAKYKYVFIDEYQDTNSVQDAIFRAISTDSARFMVGDIKQSIYRFRGADPSIFSSYRERWDEVDPEKDEGFPLEEDNGRVLLMSDNFRSTEPVTSLTNAVSDFILPFGGIPYTDGDKLICSKNGGRDMMWQDAEVCVLEGKSHNKNDSDGEDENDAEEKKKLNIEAEYVAERISAMIGTYLGDKKIEFGDVAILFRNGSNMPQFRDALMKRGIPAESNKEKPLSLSPAVLLLMCVLGFSDNPMRDIYSAGALRSPVFGFTMDDIIALHKHANHLPLYIGVLGCAADESADAALREKCRAAVAWIEREKTISRGMSPTKYVEYLIDAIDIYSIDGIRENGMERDALNRFCALAAEYETSASSPVARCDISAFIDFASEAMEESQKNEEKSEKKSDGAVTLMTMHHSKGLQFPVCFVVECGREMSDEKDANRTVVFNKTMGLGMYLPDESGLAKCDTFFRKAVGESISAEAVNEEMRVLYVALSRAETKLIVTGAVPHGGKLDNLMGSVSAEAHFSDGYFVRTAGSYLKWILGAIETKKPARVELKTYYYDEAVALINGGQRETASDADGGERKVCERIDDLDERCAFEYPYDYLAVLPSKLTVSKLAPNILDDEEDGTVTADIGGALDPREPKKTEAAAALRKPQFMTGEKYASASEKGTATHVFMQFADHRRLVENGAKAELERLVGERFMSREQADMVNLKQIERFAESSLMDKLQRSAFVKREFRFNVRMAAKDFTRDKALAEKLAESGECVTVQGVVDCVFRDPDSGELVLIDYKTDFMTDEERRDDSLADAKMRARHTNQLSYYRMICSEMFGEEVPRAYVYSTVLGRLIEI